jgi:DNA processing protein
MEIRYISAGDPGFPERLFHIPDSPRGLYVKGQLPREHIPSVAIVGARNCSVYGKNTALWFGEVLARNGVQVISGMARGIDGYAHRGALKAEAGKTFAVLGSGADVCYPAGNRDVYDRLPQRGGVLSESPPGTPPLAHLFPLRNRLISGLADAVLIIEAKEKSGSLITADCALEQGKDVYAVPGRIDDPLSAGCNNLICQGAGIAISPEKLLEDMGLFSEINIKNKEKNKNGLESLEKLVYSCLRLQAKNLEEICHEAALPMVEVQRILTVLELKGYAQEIYKNYYIRS